MKEGAADIVDALLPPEDGAITRALSELKAKLSTWSTAVANVQGALAAQAAQLAAMDSMEGTQEEAEHRGSDGGPLDRDTAVLGAEPTAESLDVQDDRDRAQAHAKGESPTAAGDDGSATPALSLSLSEPVDESQATVQDQAGEDHGLLESLDENMAEAIRVQFRLFDGRKSIRELIDGYVEEPEGAQKSWWQRVKG